MKLPARIWIGIGTKRCEERRCWTTEYREPKATAPTGPIKTRRKKRRRVKPSTFPAWSFTAEVTRFAGHLRSEIRQRRNPSRALGRPGPLASLHLAEKGQAGFRGNRPGARHSARSRPLQ